MFPLSGLVLGAFRATVVLELESVVLELESEVSLELVFPMSPSPIWGNREKAWGLLFCRAQGGGGSVDWVACAQGEVGERARRACSAVQGRRVSAQPH